MISEVTRKLFLEIQDLIPGLPKHITELELKMTPETLPVIRCEFLVNECGKLSTDSKTFEVREILSPQWPRKLTHREIRIEYDNRHRACPVCGGTSVEMTTLGIIFHDLETAKDSNSAYCHCGWRGIVHDLVPSQREDST